MKVVFTGGGTGGHFYPLIAVAESLNKIINEKNIAEAELFYFGEKAYDERALFEQRISFRAVSSGKMSLGGSPRDIVRMFSVLGGIFQALRELFDVFPDVIFAKGGYDSFPTLVAARILRIPVIIHESDTVPGRVNIWAGKFARHIALSYAEAATYFPKEKVAHTGQPMRQSVMRVTTHGSKEYLGLREDVPTLVILGGSQGAQRINDAFLDIAPMLVERYQVIHQVGTLNEEEFQLRLSTVLENSEHRSRYKVFGFLNPLAMSMAAGSASLIITRAGSTLFEIAAWETPSIIIPIPPDLSRDQTTNAFTYARHGGGIVIEEANMTPQILLSEIVRILSNENLYNDMVASLHAFAHTDAADIIAQKIVDISLEHEL
ncbi:MAG: UDP-N-acetylglucosamine--N-acetylmuramyl-(pentapeptide) pyrophosphoryl-undecaprenol N-acetylglucosamine transferase [Candidatus Pacebacteria bacterium]|nr:UDP-N-acetylglucosamine--N-acetylmuramyl-(pentapeptide) pyrophosphoryl-undecaprenol N-acetylglucosamine transferase [Candidatus Paceibacterota bacterium]MCD8507939.1 UDP-N-acetylglucosamine--N-acetylmuramyl-(pentapeptide) pyrophosphoryl-undecaprenol N-acetylglucosamine transferase [Candidatus Paceibacterota bacterium]MCD8528150.1 UDP-N-acetylglucosamine--N-acetylmuramyl-(pentapeptide) pyrophosphoryl-undecaprenol N-acetylglucosamine transferase [Candidatus Paceibacterota bacterium]MCD8563654.1